MSRMTMGSPGRSPQRGRLPVPSGSEVRRTTRRCGPAPARSSAGSARGSPARSPYIILGNPLHQGLKRVVGEGGGSLGSTCDPFRLDYEPGNGLKLPNVTLPDRGER